MLLTLLLFALLGSSVGSLGGAAFSGGDGLVLGGSLGFVLGVVLWIILWIGYQRLAPTGLQTDDEYYNPNTRYFH